MVSKHEKVDKRVKKSKKALEKALLEIMEEKDVRQITITDIVDRADVNRGTFYKHFDYKEDILKETEERILEDLRHAIQSGYNGGEFYNLEEKPIATAIYEHVYQNKNFYHLALNSIGIKDFHRTFCETIKELIMNELFYYVGSPKLNRSLLSTYHSYGFYGLLVEWDENNYMDSPEYMAEQNTQILMFDFPHMNFKIHRNTQKD